MSSSYSQSKSDTAQTTINEDNRVAGGESESITLGKNAQFHTEFSPEIADIFKEMIDLSRDAGRAILDSSESNVISTEKIFDKALSTVERSEKGSETVWTDLFPIFVVGILGIGAILVFMKKE